MTPMPLISIIMPAYNAERTIAESIQSVLAQTYTQWELLVINDGSKDQTSNVVKSINDSRIILIEQENSGVAKARNHGISKAKGELIAFLDSDDVWMKNKLEKQLTFLQANDFSIVYSKTYCLFEDTNTIKDCFVDVNIKMEDAQKILVFDFVPILTVLLYKNVLDDIGTFDLSLQGTEDWDLWIRILQKHSIGYMDEFLTIYRITANSLSRNLEKHMREELKVYEKHKKLYNATSHKGFKWFHMKKQVLIALQKKEKMTAIKLLCQMCISYPTLFIKFLTNKYCVLKSKGTYENFVNQ